MLLNEQRRTAPGVTAAQLAWDVIWQARPGWDVADWLYGEPLRYRPGAHNEPRRRDTK